MRLAHAATLGLVLWIACTEQLTAPEAIELVNRVDESFVHSTALQPWYVRLPVLSRTMMRRDAEMRSYKAIVLERVVLGPSKAGPSGCGGTRRAAHFWHAANDGVVFFPGGWFDQRLVGCSDGVVRDSAPAVHASTPDQPSWFAESVEGDISAGVAHGRCGFLTPENERLLSEEHGVTCAMTQHRVRFAARVQSFATGGPVTMRFELDSAEILGVRYTVDCRAAKSPVSSCSVPRTP